MSNSSKESDFIVKAARENRLTHCLLLQGSKSETESAALDIACALLCPVSGDKDCTCTTCHRIREGIHPDVVTLDRGEGNIPVDDIRSLRTDASIAPLEGQRRVFILKNAHNMNGAAQNAALKLFEEPPSGVTFLLLARDAAALLQTVRSRCMTVFLGSGEDEEAEGEDAQALLAAAEEQAKEFADALRADDELALFLTCQKLEKLKKPAAAAFFDAALKLVRTSLLACARGEDAPLSSLGQTRLYRMAEILLACRADTDKNAGIAHLMGTIAPLYFG